MARCPNGHESEWNDYCSACGAPIATATGPAPVATPAPDASTAAPGAGERCPSCGAAREPGAPYCESCGHDFASPVPAPAPAPVAADLDRTATVTVDRAYFDAQGVGSGLAFPDPVPAPLTIPLSGDEVSIGRRSQSRGIYPMIDLSTDHEDPAASHRQAVLTRTADGWTLTDVGSTNGTRLDPAADPISPGTPVLLTPGARFYVGAWTCITLGR
jgi:hypothetical protein